MSSTVRVIIVDDHRIFRMAIKNILSQDPMLEVIGEYADHSVLTILEEAKPDVILCDLSLENESGLELIKKIRKYDNTIKLVIMSMHKDEFHILQAIEHGIDGYLYKDDQPEEVIHGIKQVLKGDKYYSSNINEVISNRIQNNPNLANKQLFLSKKEKEVVHYLMKGHTSKEIAEYMSLSQRTVESHRYNISNKLGLKNTTELIKLITEHKIIF
jgi:DNA-binding NarL/FixJ family response regulator